MMKKRLLYMAAVSSVLILSFAACASSADQTSTADSDNKQLETVKVAVMTNTVTQWVATVGTEEGIFEKNGIDLEISEFAAGINTADAVALGQADVGYMADYAVVNRIGAVEDSTLRILASTQIAVESEGGTNFYADPEVLTTVSDISGKKIGSITGTVNDYYVDMTYEFAGISREDDNIVSVSDFSAAVAAATTGDINAFWASGNDAQKLQEAGFEPILALADIGIYTNAYLISTDQYITESQAVLTRYLVAYSETLEWIYENQEKAAEIISDKINTPKDVWTLQFNAADYRLQLKETDIETLENLEDWEFANGNFDVDYEIKDFIHSDIISAIDTKEAD